jgi:branched-chain amino acid transport system substrate-binding protein
VFRFFPSDAVVKFAHARYAVEELGKRRPAIIYQNDAYGQSGRDGLRRNLEALGVAPVSEEGLDNSVKDMLPALRKAKEAGADVLLLHLHSGPSALLVKQAASARIGLPIVAGSGMHQPSTAALLEPAEMRGVCAETASSPVSGGSPEMDAFLARYRAEFKSEPDAFAVGEFDGVSMALQAVADGAKTAAEVRDALSRMTYTGLAMTYRSDGKGNMAHSAIIVCYDGASRVPKIVKRYENVTGVL